MKRGTGLSQGREALARAAVERREASASAKSGARRDLAQRQRCDCAERPLTTRLSALRLPLWGGPFREILAKLGAPTKSAARDRWSLSLRAQAKQSRADCGGREARWIASSLRSSQ